MNKPIPLTEAFGRPVGTGRRFIVDTSGAEHRRGVTADMLRSNRNDYAPSHEDLPRGWTAATPYGRAPSQPPEYLVCVLCGSRIPDHLCELREFVSHLR